MTSDIVPKRLRFTSESPEASRAGAYTGPLWRCGSPEETCFLRREGSRSVTRHVEDAQRDIFRPLLGRFWVKTRPQWNFFEPSVALACPRKYHQRQNTILGAKKVLACADPWKSWQTSAPPTLSFGSFRSPLAINLAISAPVRTFSQPPVRESATWSNWRHWRRRRGRQCVVCGFRSRCASPHAGAGGCTRPLGTGKALTNNDKAGLRLRNQYIYICNSAA